MHTDKLLGGIGVSQNELEFVGSPLTPVRTKHAIASSCRKCYILQTSPLVL